MMLRARLDTEKSTQALKDGRMEQVIESAMERLKPEAAYFTPQKGGRTCILVFDMQDSSELPPVVEPFFDVFGAEVEVQPVMTREDLRNGLAGLK